ncbi:hypothetical protein EVAR_97771_1 [Eumeta japonica]|uniref:Uncharacterized protein n=1 Tax=Eumeta variegata TaxID=151549 RepID=A0A4C1Y7P3_EUMVA|nr:hypothetical protein EVAR_97771_1 [Eumeta japonica]
MTHCRVPPEPSARARARNERFLFHSIGRCVRIEGDSGRTQLTPSMYICRQLPFASRTGDAVRRRAGEARRRRRGARRVVADKTLTTGEMNDRELQLSFLCHFYMAAIFRYRSLLNNLDQFSA